MGKESLFDELSVILDVSPDSFIDCVSLTEFASYDSLAQIHIASMLESVFEVSVEPEDFETLDKIDLLLKMIDKC